MGNTKWENTDMTLIFILFLIMQKSRFCAIQTVGKLATDAIPHWLFLFLTIFM